ncbi:MAG: hypothetical protein Q9P01_10430 [Anaerolineae bacterium]|nr:hypothetical protein [Anaerolineae bacterium]MDQ7035224.1 hypothetical protein [Anaerolineae bacterium]
MTITHAVSQSLSRKNPILKREFKYQRFVIQRSRSGILWIGLAVLMVFPALIASVIYSIATLLNLLPIVLFYDIPTSFHAYPGVLILMMNLSLYPVVTLVTLALARGSIAREKKGRTWSILRVTTINNWQLVLGKWWASFKGLNGDHMMVIVLRVGLAAYYIGFLLPSIHGTLDEITAPYALYFAAITPLLVLQAFFDALLTAAIGVIAAVPDEAVGTVTTSAVLMLRFVMVLLVGVWIVQIMNTLRFSLTTALIIAIGGTVITGILVILGLGFAYYLLEQT